MEARIGDKRIAELLAPLHHPATACCVAAERAMNRRLNGGCQVPIAGYAVIETDQQLWLRGLVGSPDGKQLLRAERRGNLADAEQIGMAVADQLLTQGADAILQAVYAS